jgi:peptidoglycan/LPS O-acetylase OafA/YrhL
MGVFQTKSAVSRKNFDSIQLFRFLAALAVIICHSSFYASERLVPGSYIYHEGSAGVSLFFVISGFVMIVSSEKLINKVGGWREFVVKRIVRIVPIYYLITTFKLIVLITATSLILHSELDSLLILKSYLFIPALNVDNEFRPLYGVGWTLNFEMFFYLLFALCLAFKFKPIPTLSIIFGLLASASFFKTPDWSDWSFYADPIVLNFVYGMVAAKLIVKGRLMPTFISVGIVVVGLIYMFVPRVGILSDFKINTWIGGLSSFLVVYGGASMDFKPRVKIYPWLIYLGGASYSLYLIHPTISPMVPALLKRVGAYSTLASIPLSVALSLIAGTVFYKFIEVPLTKWCSDRVRNSFKAEVVNVAVPNKSK